jgi:pyruvate/2-oxoglutarate dehydrogenase complex dihydrolipoamide dehydrogenase (E3) component
MPGVHDVPFLTSSSIMDIDFLPKHFIIVGGSYVGLVFAQIYLSLAKRDGSVGEILLVV